MADQAQLLQLLTSISDRLARVELAVAGGAGGSGGAAPAATDAAPAAGGGGGGSSENVANYAAFASEAGAAWIEATKACGKKANKAANNMKKILDFNAGLVTKAETCRKPTDAELTDFGKKIKKFANNGLRAQFPDRNMEKGLAEIFNAMAALLHPTPVQTVKDSFESMQFYTNKVLSANKGKADKEHLIKWVKASEELLTRFRKFCVFSMRGLKWKGKDDPTADAPAAASGGGAKAEPAPAPAPAPAASTGGPPPPPAGMSAPEAPKPEPAPAPSGGGLNVAGLFAEIRGIDQSSGKTAGLKHVTDKQKAYKNRSLVKSSVVSENAIKKKKKKGGAKKKAAPKKVLPPRCEYDKRQSTWFVENQPDGERITVTIEKPNDKVYLYKCGDCVINLNGRLKALNVVNCKKTQLTFEDLLAVVEVNNCTSVKIQSLGKCPAMTIDKTNGCQVYLSRTSLDCNFVCAQSSEMNVNFPHGDEADEEWIELPIPEQFQHKIVGTTLTSEVSDLYGH